MKHPDISYVFINVTNELGVVKWGESGYYPTNYGNHFNQKLVDNLNKKLGLSEEESTAMRYCSMASIPETNEAWEKHYKKCIGIARKCIKKREEKERKCG